MSTYPPVYMLWADERYRRAYEEGIRRGKARVKAWQLVEAVLLVLGGRGFDIPDDARARIDSCTDLAQLETWLIRAATVPTMPELFD